MPDLKFYMERTAGHSPTRFGFNRRGAGKSRYTLLIGNDGNPENVLLSPAVTSPKQVHDAILDLIGSTHTHPDGTKLARKMPKADPFNWFLFVDDIAEGAGRGPFTVHDAAEFQTQPLEVETLDKLVLYGCYEFDVSFTPRPYALATDDQIETGLVSWTPITGSVDFGNYAYAKEWKRYVDIDHVPSNEYITAQAGQFAIDVASTFAPDNVQAGQGQLRMLIKKDAIKMTWYEVPYEYITGSAIGVGVAAVDPNPQARTYISEGFGCVNQHDWVFSNDVTYRKGTMLFEALGVERYTPPIPRTTKWGGDNLIYAGQKLCNITFIFLRLDPPLGKDQGWRPPQVPAAGARATPRPPPDPPGDNVVQQGHNLVPYAHSMSWYYARTINQNFLESNGRPVFPSFPFELLFTNPNVVA